jgi:hypothetical protein
LIELREIIALWVSCFATVVEEVGRRTVSDLVIIEEEVLHPVVIGLAISPAEVDSDIQSPKVVILVRVSKAENYIPYSNC